MGDTSFLRPLAHIPLNPARDAAAAALTAIRMKMDEYAGEIFDLWFYGKVKDEVTFDNEKWANYMRRETNLARHIDEELLAFARSIVAKMKADPTCTGRLSSPFKLTFHAEVGSQDGGYATGYEVLHGTNRDAGDFQVTGSLRVTSILPVQGAYTATFDNLVFVFNDIVDVNKKYEKDVGRARVAVDLANALDAGPPRDYILRIKWSPLDRKVFQIDNKAYQLNNKWW